MDIASQDAFHDVLFPVLLSFSSSLSRFHQQSIVLTLFYCYKLFRLQMVSFYMKITNYFPCKCFSPFRLKYLLMLLLFFVFEKFNLLLNLANWVLRVLFEQLVIKPRPNWIEWNWMLSQKKLLCTSWRRPGDVLETKTSLGSASSNSLTYGINTDVSRWAKWEGDPLLSTI